MPNKKKRYNGLTHEERMFALNILAGYNQTDAYQLVYPKASPESARRSGSKMLTKVDVIRFLDERRAILCEKAERKAEEVIRELEKIGFSRITNYLSFSNAGVVLKDSRDIRPEFLDAIESVKSIKGGRNISLKLYNKIAGLIALCEYHGLLKNKNSDIDKDYTIRVLPIPE